jgi:hypothetical protein
MWSVPIPIFPMIPGPFLTAQEPFRTAMVGCGAFVLLVLAILVVRAARDRGPRTSTARVLTFGRPAPRGLPADAYRAAG